MILLTTLKHILVIIIKTDNNIHFQLFEALKKIHYTITYDFKHLI